MKTKTNIKKIISVGLIFVAIVFSCKKKNTPTADPTPITQPPASTTTYSVFSSIIAIIDYTAPTNAATSSYTANLSPTTTAMAYIIADGTRIDSLPLTITRVADIVPSTVTSSTATPCDANIWNTYSLNSKNFKVKIGGANSLQIFENSVLVSSRSILIEDTYTILDFDKSKAFNTLSPKTNGNPCADGLRYYVMQ